MPATPAITSSGGASQPKRPRPIPKEIRAVVALMVNGIHGTEDDPRPLSFVEAARAVGVRPDRARHYLDRVEVRRLLIAERRAWRAAICAANETALQRVRDTSVNGMATVAAVRCLEELDEHHE